MAEETTRTVNYSQNVEERRNSTVKRRSSGSSDPKTSDETDMQPDEMAGEEATGEGTGLEGSAERYAAEDELVGEEANASTEDVVRKSSSKKSTRKRRGGGRGGKGMVLEYDLSDMYPEMSLLSQNTKKEWNFHDPEIIRAIWLESRTNALAAWKYKHTAIIKKKKPEMQVQMNHAVQLRHEFMERKKEREKEKTQRQLAMHTIGRDAPDFQELKLPTTTTAEMRYKFNRDNPPVPKYYLHHFEKYKKPPFKTKVSSSTGCDPNVLSNG